MSELLTTGQLIDNLKLGQRAESEAGLYKVQRTTRGIVFNDNVALSVTGFITALKWRVLPSYVSFEEAMKAWDQGKTVYYHHELAHVTKPTKLTSEQCENKHRLEATELRSHALISLWKGKWTIEGDTP